MYLSFASVDFSENTDSGDPGDGREQNVSPHGQDIEQIKQRQRHLDKWKKLAVKAEALSDYVISDKRGYKHFVADKLESRKGRHKDAHEPTHILWDPPYFTVVIEKIAGNNYAHYDKAEFHILHKVGFSRRHFIVFEMIHLVLLLSIQL